MPIHRVDLTDQSSLLDPPALTERGGGCFHSVT
jgi:hypothetical protein